MADGFGDRLSYSYGGRQMVLVLCGNVLGNISECCRCQGVRRLFSLRVPIMSMGAFGSAEMHLYIHISCPLPRPC